jgi:hypothetical protein
LAPMERPFRNDMVVTVSCFYRHEWGRNLSCLILYTGFDSIVRMK